MLVLFSLTVENALEISTCPLGFAACISKNLCLFRFSGGQNLITNSLGLLGDTYSDISLKDLFETIFSPSHRTVSSLVTDCESEHDGLRVFINRTERTPLMRRTRVLDDFYDFWG